MRWREAAAIGILNEYRVLIRVGILNIGLDIGVLNTTLFSMMVVMSVGTTLMTTPLLTWFYKNAEDTGLTRR